MADAVSREVKGLKIMTWNINGIRAVTRGTTLKNLLDELNADIVCFQETKITRDMLEESICIVQGYNAYFSFSRDKTGYSGVVTFCRDSVTPCGAEEGLTSQWTTEATIGWYGNTDDFPTDHLTSLDKEGRTVLTEHDLDNGEKLVIINTYCPRADFDNEDRMQFKLDYHKLLQRRVEALIEAGRHVIVLGDLNVTHKPIDHCNPGDLKTYNASPSRIWMNQFVKEITVTELPNKDSKPDKQVSVTGLLVDSLRYIHLQQKDAYTNWCTSTGARQTNYGKRLDYILGDVLLIKQRFLDCVIRPEVEGSDHCPVVALLSGDIIPAKRPPALCTKYMPEFSGKQQNLASYFTMKTKNNPSTDSNAITSKETANQLKRTIKCVGNQPQAKRVKSTPPGQPSNLLQFFERRLSDSSALSSTSNGDTDSDSLPSSGSSVQASSQSNLQSDSQKPLEMIAAPPKLKEGSFQPSGVFPTKNDEHRKAEVSLWKTILKGPPPAPLCPGHHEPCVLRTVKKKGPNYGRQFYCCARPEGHSSNKEARCKFFKWTK